VAVTEGTIVLSGVVTTDQAREAAIAIAGEYAGARVINNITIQADMADLSARRNWL
jgi:osmotically-inducible protein OsmY